MKFLHLTDVHFKTETPNCRTDQDYAGSLLADFTYALKIAKAEGVQYLLHSGDFFDHTRPSYELLSGIVRLLRYYEITMVTVVGQHDTAGKAAQLYPKWGLGILESAGVAIVLNAGKEESLELQDVVIHGFSFGTPKTKQLLAGEFQFGTEGKPTIGLVHASVVGKDSPVFSSEMVRVTDLPILDDGAVDRDLPSLFLFGDIHSGFETLAQSKRSHLVNIGAFSRANWDDREREVLLAIVELTPKGFKLDVLEVPQPEGLFTDNRKAEKGYVGMSQKFQAELESIRRDNSKSKFDIVRESAEVLGYSEEVVQKVVRYLQ